MIAELWGTISITLGMDHVFNSRLQWMTGSIDEARNNVIIEKRKYSKQTKL